MAIHMTAGNRLRDYTLTTDMTASDAGTSMWAFAEKDGFDFFVKCYLSPVFPDPQGPGTEKSKRRKRARCVAFETRMNRVEEILQSCGDAAFLVRSTDFFREDGSYFKVTKKIHPSPTEVWTFPARKQLLVLLSAAYALKVLHQNSNFIHADIKPENFLVQRVGVGTIANLIDFDAGFFIGSPPLAEEQVGDPSYSAPEMITWVSQEPESRPKRKPALLQALDIFSLGLTFCKYLSGTLPEYPGGYAYPGEAVLDGIRLQAPEPKRPHLAALKGLIDRMLDPNPLCRPNASWVHEQLRNFNRAQYVSETTYRRIAASLKQGLSAGGKALRERLLPAQAKAVCPNSTNLRLRGLKAAQGKKISPLVKPFRFGKKE